MPLNSIPGWMSAFPTMSTARRLEIFRVYQRAAKRRDRLSGAYLEAYDQALERVSMRAAIEVAKDESKLDECQIAESSKSI